MSIVNILKKVEAIYDSLRESNRNIAMCYNGEWVYFEDVTKDDVARSPKMAWDELEAYDPAVLKAVVTQTFSNIILSREFILQSEFQIADKVDLFFHEAGTIKGCEIIKVHFTDKKVQYDVEVSMHVDETKEQPAHTKKGRLYNIESWFVLKAS